MTPTITDRLDEIAGRADAATEGPWSVYDRGVGCHIALDDGVGDRILPEGFRTDIGRNEDAAFIAAARTDIPALVAALRAVLALHVAEDRGTGPHCAGCATVATFTHYPCPTVTAITAALIGAR